jgi:hypothetical protein
MASLFHQPKRGQRGPHHKENYMKAAYVILLGLILAFAMLVPAEGNPQDVVPYVVGGGPGFRVYKMVNQGCELYVVTGSAGWSVEHPTPISITSGRCN